jgi:hypothetical protein
MSQERFSTPFISPMDRNPAYVQALYFFHGFAHCGGHRFGKVCREAHESCADEIIKNESETRTFRVALRPSEAHAATASLE